MRKPLSAFIIVFLLLGNFFNFSLVSADEQSYTQARPEIQSVKTTNPNLPTTQGEQKGSVGFILSRLFDGNGKISNWFLSVLGNRSNNAVLRWSGNNGGQLVQGSIFDNGTNVGIGTNPNSYKLNVGGDINFTGEIRQNGTILNLSGKFLDGATSGEIYYTGGNVGIGTNNPNYTLDIAGTLNATNLRGNGSQITNINGDAITDGSIDASEIAANSIGNSELSGNAVNSGNIVDGSITSGDIANNTITETDISDSFVARDASLFNGMNTNSFIQTTGNQTISGIKSFSSTISGATGVAYQWEGGVNSITNNDGGGNVQIRFGNDFSSSSERFTHDGTAFYIGGGLDSSNGSLELKVASNGGSGNNQVVSWGPTLSIGETNISWGGANLLSESTSISGDQITDNTIDSSEIQNDTITETDISNSFIARNSNLLDGINSTSFLRSDANDNFTGTLGATNYGVGNQILSFGAANRGLKYITDQEGIALSADSSILLHAGDNVDNLVAEKGIVAGTTSENLYLTADTFVEISTNRQSSAGDVKNFRFNTNGTATFNGNTVLTTGSSINGDIIVDNTIDSSEIQNNTITGTDILNESITNADIDDGTVRTNEIANDTITESDISNSYIARNANLLDGYNSSQSSNVNTVAVRNGSGDINARLFRSEYDSTNSSINFIMTQVDTASNNYIRPSTPAQFRASVTDSTYINIGSSGDQIQDGTIDSSEIQNNTLTANDLANNSVGNDELINNPTVGELFITGTNYARLEMRDTNGTQWPYIDFSNDASTNFDVRLRQDGDNQILVEGGNLKVQDYNLQTERDLYIGENGAGNTDSYWYDDNTNTWRGIRWNDGNNRFELEENNGSYYRILREGHTGDYIADGTIDSSEIQNDTITGADIANNTLTASDIGPNSINGSELNSNSIASSHITDGQVMRNDLNANAKTTCSVVSLSVLELTSAERPNGNRFLPSPNSIAFRCRQKGYDFGMPLKMFENWCSYGNARIAEYKENAQNGANLGWREVSCSDERAVATAVCCHQ